MAQAGVPESWLTSPIGTLKTAGAAGLLLGLIAVPLIGTAAAIGLVLFFVCAVYTHIRASDYSAQFGLAIGFGLLAVAALTLHLASAETLVPRADSSDLIEALVADRRWSRRRLADYLAVLLRSTFVRGPPGRARCPAHAPSRSGHDVADDLESDHPGRRRQLSLSQSRSAGLGERTGIVAGPPDLNRPGAVAGPGWPAGSAPVTRRAVLAAAGAGRAPRGSSRHRRVRGPRGRAPLTAGGSCATGRARRRP